ncbi:hypothetical protein [Streptomyces clavifer]|uniref:hypothetical protein n=1 Tax=Streptomyces clavifer TaxID=68188 RepID=UPI00382569A8
MRPTWAAQALRDTTIEYVTTTSALAEPDPRALGHAPEVIYRRSAAGGAGKGRVRALIAATPAEAAEAGPTPTARPPVPPNCFPASSLLRALRSRSESGRFRM